MNFKVSVVWFDVPLSLLSDSRALDLNSFVIKLCHSWGHKSTAFLTSISHGGSRRLPTAWRVCFGQLGVNSWRQKKKRAVGPIPTSQVVIVIVVVVISLSQNYTIHKARKSNDESIFFLNLFSSGHNLFL